ncbi:hypothetical protein V7794_09095 [Rhizobium laguerreae]
MREHRIGVPTFLAKTDRRSPKPAVLHARYWRRLGPARVAHVRQINSRLGVETLSRLRSMADVTVETTPQNLFFTSDDYESRKVPS